MTKYKSLIKEANGSFFGLNQLDQDAKREVKSGDRDKCISGPCGIGLILMGTKREKV